jgi:hypothetical protein
MDFEAGENKAVDLLSEFGGEFEEGGGEVLRVWGCGCYGAARCGEGWEGVEGVARNTGL